MTDRLTLGQRLLLLVCLPLLGMMGFAGLAAWTHWQEAANMQHAAALIELSTRTGDVIHLMQVERGASASGGEPLKQARAALDTAQQGMLAAAEQASLSEEDRTLAKDEFQALQALNALRQQVDQHSGTATQHQGQYTALIEKLMGLATLTVQRSTHAEITRQITAQLALLCEKEFAGREQALLASALARQTLDDASRRQVQEGMGRQQSCLSQFSSLATPALRDAYLAIGTIPAYQDALALREKILTAGPAQSGISREVWSAAAASRIEAIKGMLDTFSHAMIAQVSEMNDSARQRAALSAGAAVLTTLAAIVLSMLTMRALRREVRALQSVMDNTSHSLDLTLRYLKL